ncbi:tyrosine-type recombinase/integrase [Streptomyces collinus]|uniref:tyrosine-type recombinase/integrase n=1 Tax=Streptomyces collinus TaxID=42684 RepID=UPI0036E3FF46
MRIPAPLRRPPRSPFRPRWRGCERGYSEGPESLRSACAFRLLSSWRVARAGPTDTACVGHRALAGERDLPLPAPVLAALKSFRALQAKEKLVLGEAYSDSGYVVVHETGEAFTIKQLRRRAYRLMEILELRIVRLYDARSSCLTYLANKGVPDHILARWAGHTNVKTTKKWYVKPDVEDLRGAATTWDGLHGAATEGQA